MCDLKNRDWRISSFSVFQYTVNSTGGPSARLEEKIYVNETYANATLAFKRCCVTKMRFTRVWMGTLRVCFKYLKFNVLWIKLTNFAFLPYPLLFHGVWGHFEAFSSAGGGVPLENFFLSSRSWAACVNSRLVRLPSFPSFGTKPAGQNRAEKLPLSIKSFYREKTPF